MATPVPDELREGLDPQYSLQEELGRGGMSTVYLAYDTKHCRRVALKVLSPELAESLGADRFRREIGTLAQLTHPHILSVHDSGDAAGYLWYSMPYVEGESLRARLERESQLPVDEALRIARDVAGALEYAHARGIIHRDVKPENVLLTDQGDALLADFGIARTLREPTAGLTTTGTVIGTPLYMSPEQASGVVKIDARSDLYALGAVLYEMLAGAPPFPGPMPQALIAMISRETPTIRRIRPEVPAGVDAAIRRALALAPADRWASAADFANALADAAPRPSAMVWTRLTTRWAVAAAIALGLGIAVGGGALLANGAGARATEPGAVRLAVLPFENAGDSADAYFADGVTDAVRGKLAGVPGLEVIGSSSSRQYRRTSKTPRQIGTELGVRYLLEGRVRWAKGSDGTSRVRVSPELIDARTAADKWQQPFDAPLTNVFQVQSEIAEQVATQLEIALTPATAQTLADRPTADLTAYDAYLRGKALAHIGGRPELEQREVALFTQAVTRDSTFALAWAALASAQAGDYAYGVPRPALAEAADRNSARALALAPGLAEAHLARASYWFRVRMDPARALAEDSAALALAPRDAQGLRRMGDLEEVLGRWDAAETHMAAAARIDPQSVMVANDLGHLALLRRDYAQARSVLGHAVALAPTNLDVIEDNVLLALAAGDLAGAHAFLRSVPSSVDRNRLVAFLALYGDLAWVLDSSDAERLRNLKPEAFGGDRASWALVLTQLYAWRGERQRALAYADTARAAWEEQLAAAPNDAQRRALLGVTLAYLGQRDAAIREGERAAALAPIARDGINGPYVQHQLVRIYTLLDEPEKALNALEPLLRIPCYLSPRWLSIDPNLAPLRGNPRFERLARN